MTAYIDCLHFSVCVVCLLLNAVARTPSALVLEPGDLAAVGGGDDVVVVEEDAVEAETAPPKEATDAKSVDQDFESLTALRTVQSEVVFDGRITSSRLLPITVADSNETAVASDPNGSAYGSMNSSATKNDSLLNRTSTAATTRTSTTRIAIIVMFVYRVHKKPQHLTSQKSIFTFPQPMSGTSHSLHRHRRHRTNNDPSRWSSHSLVTRHSNVTVYVRCSMRSDVTNTSSSVADDNSTAQSIQRQHQSLIAPVELSARGVTESTATIGSSFSDEFSTISCSALTAPSPNVRYVVFGRWRANATEIENDDITSGSGAVRRHVTHQTRTGVGGGGGTGRVNGDLLFGHLLPAGETLQRLVQDYSRPNFGRPAKAYVNPSRRSHQRLLTVGERLQLVCRTSGHPKPTVTWLKDGLPVESPNEHGFHVSVGRRQSLLYRSHAQRSDAGVYVCVASNVFGTSRSAPLQIYVKNQELEKQFSRRCDENDGKPYCHNDGLCFVATSLHNARYCRCPAGWEGVRCGEKSASNEQKKLLENEAITTLEQEAAFTGSDGL